MTSNSDSWEYRFWSKVNKTNSCWEWIANKDKDGYGKFQIGGKGSQKHYRAHRIAYYIEHGVMPSCSELVLHKCDNPSCVKYSHLYLGTQKENIRDAMVKGRHSVANGSGHPRSKLNEQEVLLIRSLNLSANKIAMCFGVSRSTVQNIKSGRQWRHIL